MLAKAAQLSHEVTDRLGKGFDTFSGYFDWILRDGEIGGGWLNLCFLRGHVNIQELVAFVRTNQVVLFLTIHPSPEVLVPCQRPRLKRLKVAVSKFTEYLVKQEGF